MKSFVSTQPSIVSSGASNRLTMIADEFRKGYQVKDIPYQTNGILAFSLWTSQSSVLRIIPAYDETGHAVPQVINVDRYSLNGNPMDHLPDTFTTATTVDRLGSIKRPLVIDYAPGSPDAFTYGPDTAISLFIRAIYNACDTKSKSKRGTCTPIPEWSGWIMFGGGQKVAWPKTALMMQALAFIVNGRANYDLENERELRDEHGRPLPVLCVAVLNARDAINQLVSDLVTPNNPGLPLNAKSNNRLGPFAEQDGIVLFLNSSTISGATVGAGGGARSKYVLKASVQSADKTTGWTPTPHRLTDEQVQAYWHPWDRLIKFLSYDEQMHLLAQEFGADTVNYVFTKDRNCLERGAKVPEDIAEAGLGRYSCTTPFLMPGMGSQSASSSLGMPGPDQAPAGAGLGLGLGFGEAKTASAPAPMPAAPQAPAAPAGIASGFAFGQRRQDGVLGAGARTNSLGIPEGSGVDIAALQAQINDIRAAAGAAQQTSNEDRAAKAGDLLDGDDFTFGQEG